jgi:hypothetical protein
MNPPGTVPGAPGGEPGGDSMALHSPALSNANKSPDACPPPPPPWPPPPSLTPCSFIAAACHLFIYLLFVRSLSQPAVARRGEGVVGQWEDEENEKAAEKDDDNEESIHCKTGALATMLHDDVTLYDDVTLIMMT